MRDKTTIHDIDDVADEHFDSSRMASVEWMARAKSFAHAMASCDRAVILTIDDDGYLQLSSIQSGVNQLIATRKAKR